MRMGLFAITTFLLAPAAFQPSAPIRAQEGSIQIVELTAKKYEFSPSPIRVRAGTSVRLKITATDHDHGIDIPVVPDGADKSSATGIVLTNPQKCWQLRKGVETTIDLETKTAGTYTFKCCHFCGLGHHGMKGQIIVE